MEVRIEKLVYGGDGLAHHDGHTVFVPLVLPGELVRIESSARKKKFIRGQVGTRRGSLAGARAGPVPAFWTLRRLPVPAHAVRSAASVQGGNSSRDARAHRAHPVDRRRSRRTLRRHLDIAIERNGNCERISRARREARGSAISRWGARDFAPSTECTILSPRLAETFSRLRRIVSQGKVLSAIDEIEAFADSSDEKILLNLSAERLADSPESIAVRAARSRCRTWNRF